jgi:alginate O-acetyltransferase complex protein AlgI
MIALYWSIRIVPSPYPYVAGWIALIGLALILHFGCFDLLSCLYRKYGIAARPIMDHPLKAGTLSEFWRRWNTAFRDLVHVCVFRPLVRHVTAPVALMACFLFSGVIHDIVISVPARGGYGGPTLYFAIQGLGVVIEHGTLGQRLRLNRGWRGRVFAIICVLVPIGALFHRPFLEHVIVPFTRAIGGLS